MRAAVRYKVDASKITAGATAELSAKKKDPKSQPRNLPKKGTVKDRNKRRGSDSI
jgi:hypothetical protein